MQTETPTFRFGTRYVMAYTTVCCIGFGVLFASRRANHYEPIDAFVDVVALMAFVLGLAVVGLGPAAVRQSFQFVGKICISFLVGGVVAILSMAFAASRGAAEHSLLFLAAGWICGFLIAMIIAFRKRLLGLLQP